MHIRSAVFFLARVIHYIDMHCSLVVSACRRTEFNNFFGMINEDPIELFIGCDNYTSRIMRKRDTNDIFFKTEILMTSDWYYYKEPSAEILELYLYISRSYATFCFTLIIHCVLTAITLIGRHAKRCGCH